MSICIAAKYDSESSHVVACCDWQVSTESVSSESSFKLRILGDRWIAMSAGSPETTKEVLDIYETSLPTPDEDGNPIEALRRPLRQWRKRLAEAYISDAHALTFEEFYTKGKLWLDQDVWSETQRGIGKRYESETVNVQLILIGYVLGKVLIYMVSRGDLRECSELAVVGSGYAVAEAALYWRMTHDERGLEQTKYSVYEAKRLSELSPYVGYKSSMVVIHPSKEGTRLKWEYVDISELKIKFKRFGPKLYRDTRKTITGVSRYLSNPAAPSDPQSTTADASHLPPSPE